MITVSIKCLIAHLDKKDKRTGLVLKRWGSTSKYDIDDADLTNDLEEALLKDSLEGEKIGDNFVRWIADWLEFFNALVKRDYPSTWSVQGVKAKLDIPDFGAVELQFDWFALLDCINRCESIKLLE